MTLGFALLTGGAAMIYTAFKNMTLADLALGRPGPGQPPPIVDPESLEESGGGGGGTAGKGGGEVVVGSSGYPLAQHGQIIGSPYTGTHTIGNWQSDNAVDIAVPVGTKVLAVAEGRIGPVAGPFSSDISGRFSGGAIYLYLKGGGQVWYKHLTKSHCHTGQKVKRGQVIAESGGGNGVEHLHFAAKPPLSPTRFT